MGSSINKWWFVRDIWHKYLSWYFKIVSNFTRPTARGIYAKYHYKSCYYVYKLWRSDWWILPAWAYSPTSPQRPPWRQKKVGVVERWPLWGGREVIWQFFREYNMFIVLTSCLLYHNSNATIYNNYIQIQCPKTWLSSKWWMKQRKPII